MDLYVLIENGDLTSLCYTEDSTCPLRGTDGDVAGFTRSDNQGKRRSEGVLLGALWAWTKHISEALG